MDKKCWEGYETINIRVGKQELIKWKNDAPNKEKNRLLYDKERHKYLVNDV